MPNQKKGVRRVRLPSGLYFTIDAGDFDEVIKYKWYGNTKIHQSCYVRRFNKVGLKPRITLLHRHLLGITDPKIIVDHKDGNPLNNTRKNLRIATFSQNNANRKSWANSASKYLGVTRYIHSKRKPWRAVLCKNGKSKFLGEFATQEEAALAYNKEAKKQHGKFARLNKVTKHK